jgi:AAA+ ATPase superfamily predicted ATPase
MFFGREDDFRFVKNKVDNEKYGSLIVLFGERRAGKTSVLYQLLGGRLGPSYLPVFLDMQAMAINNDNEFLGRLAELTAGQLGARLGKTDLSKFDDHTRNPYPLFEKFIDQVIESIGEDKVLLLVDEYELIEDKVADGKIRKEIFHFLSGLVEHKPGLFLIFAGNHRLQDRQHSFWEPLLQRCDYRNISYLTPNDTRRLIQEPVRGKVFFIGTTVRDIMRLTAGQPFYTQLVCRNMVELLNDERRNFFYEADISDVVREIIDNPPPQLIYFWAGMDTLEKLVLSTVAEAARHTTSFPNLAEMRHALKKYTVELTEDDLKKMCERMTSREILERGPRESYRFRMDLYRLWIREEHHLYSVAREFEREISTVNK